MRSMKVWVYSRLSNDDDREMNSLLNQQEICRAFAELRGHQVIGQSSVSVKTVGDLSG